MKPSMWIGFPLLAVFVPLFQIADTACSTTSYDIETNAVSEPSPEPDQTTRGVPFFPEFETNNRKYFRVKSESEAAIILSETAAISNSDDFYIIELSESGSTSIYKTATLVASVASAPDLVTESDFTDLYVEVSNDDTIHVGLASTDSDILSWKDTDGIIDVNYILVQNYNADAAVAEWEFCDGVVKLLTNNYGGSSLTTGSSGTEDNVSPCDTPVVTGPCSAALGIDGNLGSGDLTSGSGGYCTVLENTAGSMGPHPGWWYVDLGTMYDVKAVLVLNGAGSIGSGGSAVDYKDVQWVSEQNNQQNAVDSEQSVKTTIDQVAIFSAAPELEDVEVRIGSCDRSSLASIKKNAECDVSVSSGEATSQNNRWIFKECDINYYGQYVYLLKDAVPAEDIQFFSVCEVEVWGIDLSDGDRPKVGFTVDSVSELEGDIVDATYSVSVMWTDGSADHPTCLEYNIVRAVDLSPIATGPGTGNDDDYTDDDTNFAISSITIDPSDDAVSTFTDAVTYQDDICEEDDEKFGYIIVPVTAGLLVGDADANTYEQITFTLLNDDVTYCWASITVSEFEAVKKITAILRREGNTALPSTAVVDTSDGSATFPEDYTSLVSHDVVFNANDLEKEVDVIIVDDDCVESTNVFGITIDAVNSDGKICEDVDGAAQPTVVAAILNDDAEFQFQDNDGMGSDPRVYVVSETEQTIEVVVERTGYLDNEVTIAVESQSWSIVDEAASPSDYEEVDQVLTFAPGLSTASLTVTVTNDKEVEPADGANTPNEIFQLVLNKYPTDLDDCVIGPVAMTNIEIVDDDCYWSMKEATHEIREDKGPTQIEVVCERPSCTDPCEQMNRPFTAEYSISSADVPDETAANDEDFIPKQDSVTLRGDGETISFSKDVTINIVDDIHEEQLEKFEVKLTDSDGVIQEDNTTTVSILDNDVTISLVCDESNNVHEGVGTLTITLKRTGDLLESDSVLLFTNPDTATSDKDYTSIGSVIKTFNVGVNSLSHDIAIHEDTEHEINEDFFVQISPYSESYVDPNKNICAWTIVDNDCTFFLTATEANKEITEGSVSTVSVTVSRTGSLSRAASIVLTTSTINGGAASDATPGEDYVSVATTVTFQPNDASETIFIRINDDEETEMTEYILVSLGDADCSVNGNNQVVIQINDDDESYVQMASPKVTFGEADEIAYVSVERSGSLSKTETVYLRVRPLEVRGSSSAATANSDFSDDDITAVFQISDDSVTVEVLIYDDSFEEGLESFVVEIIDLSDDTDATINNDFRETVVCIRDNDGTFQLEVLENSVSEGTGVPVTILRTGDTGKAQTVYLTTKDVEATSGIDYEALISAPVVFPPGAESRVISITTYNDQELEASESFVVILTSDTGNDLGQSVSYITIVDDDHEIHFTSTPDSTFVDNSVTVSESVDYVRLTIERSKYDGNLPSGIATVSVTARELTSIVIPQTGATPAEKDGAERDFEFDDLTVTLQSHQRKVDILVKIVDDNIAEKREAFEVYLTNAQPSGDNKIIYPNSVVVYINDDDGGLPGDGDEESGGDRITLSTPLIIGIVGGVGVVILLTVLCLLGMYALNRFRGSAPAAAALAPRVLPPSRPPSYQYPPPQQFINGSRKLPLPRSYYP